MWARTVASGVVLTASIARRAAARAGSPSKRAVSTGVGDRIRLTVVTMTSYRPGGFLGGIQVAYHSYAGRRTESGSAAKNRLPTVITTCRLLSMILFPSRRPHSVLVVL